VFVDTNVPVLVNEDTIYRREDHNKRLLLFRGVGVGSRALPWYKANNPYVLVDNWQEPNRKPADLYPFRQVTVSTPVGQPFLGLYPKRPPPQLFFDTFASVYTVLERYGQLGTTTFTPNQPQFIYFWQNKPSFDFFVDRSLDTGQTNHPFPHVIQIGIGLFPYSFEVPDLNDNPWLEQVHRPPNPEALLFPFRQIPQFIIGQPFNLTWWKGKNWDIEAEPIWRVPDTSTLNQFRWREIFVPPVIVIPAIRTRSAWTADSGLVTADSINFTCDGADLVNNGSVTIKEGGGLAYSVSVPLFVQFPGSTKPST
jgi:hypothetical protein